MDPLGGLFQQFAGPVGVGRVQVGTELFVLLFVAQEFVGAHDGFGDVVGVEAAEGLAADHVEVAGDGSQNAVQADRRC